MSIYHLTASEHNHANSPCMEYQIKLTFGTTPQFSGIERHRVFPYSIKTCSQRHSMNYKQININTFDSTCHRFENATVLNSFKKSDEIKTWIFLMK